MDPKYKILNGQNIAVYENKPDGKTLVFVHGNSLSSKPFQKQFNSELLKEFRMIAFDLPGHGKSSDANNPEKEYSVPEFQEILFGLIREMQIKEAVFVGHSLGGHIVMESIPELENICKGIVIFGAPPMQGQNHPSEKSHFPNPLFPLAFSSELNDEQVSQLAAMLSREGQPAPELFTSDIKRTDPLMRPNLGKNSTPDKLPDESALIACINYPIAVFHGKYDAVIRSDYFEELEIPTLWKRKVQLIDSGHSPQYENPEEFNRLLIEFCKDVY